MLNRFKYFMNERGLWQMEDLVVSKKVTNPFMRLRIVDYFERSQRDVDFLFECLRMQISFEWCTSVLEELMIGTWVLCSSVKLKNMKTVEISAKLGFLWKLEIISVSVWVTDCVNIYYLYSASTMFIFILVTFNQIQIFIILRIFYFNYHEGVTASVLLLNLIFTNSKWNKIMDFFILSFSLLFSYFRFLLIL